MSRPMRDEVGARVAVADARDVLLDDRPVVELGRHVVRGRADHLDAALERAVVRARARERRQERVVDVDRGRGEPLEEVRRRGSACSGRARRGRRRRAARAAAPRPRACRSDGTWWNGRPWSATRSREIGVVRDRPAPDVPSSSPLLEAPEEVEQAVVVPGDEDRDALLGVRRGEAPVHLEALGELAEARPTGPRSSSASTRRKKRSPVECCSASTMFAPRSKRKFETAATIPGRSVQVMRSRMCSSMVR